MSYYLADPSWINVMRVYYRGNNSFHVTYKRAFNISTTKCGSVDPFKGRPKAQRWNFRDDPWKIEFSESLKEKIPRVCPHDLFIVL